jgi:methylthioribose-1-phosphate isomerase
VRTIDWADGKIRIIDQTRLPAEEDVLCLSTVEELAEAISSLRVRGAPALDVAGGLGVALAAQRAEENGDDVGEAISQAASLLASTRPTAVNLQWGIERIKKIYDPTRPQTISELIEQARAMVAEDQKTNRVIGEIGADLLTKGSRVRRHACTSHLGHRHRTWRGPSRCRRSTSLDRAFTENGKSRFVWE